MLACLLQLPAAAGGVRLCMYEAVAVLEADARSRWPDGGRPRTGPNRTVVSAPGVLVV